MPVVLADFQRLAPGIRMTAQSPIIPRLRIGRWLGILNILLAIGTGIRVWQLNIAEPRTNDAMIRANIVNVVLQHVNGKVMDLPIQDNQYVHKGDLLYRIDPRPYEAALAAAEAELKVAENELAGQMAMLRAAEANIRQRAEEIASIQAEISGLEAEAGYARSYLHRLKPLEDKVYVTENAVQKADAQSRSAAASVNNARARQRSLEQQMEAAHQDRTRVEADLARNGEHYARIQAAEAKRRKAQLDLEYCEVHATFDGWVTNLNTSQGQFVEPGQTLFALVNDQTWYVIANYKETYLRSIQPGMAVDVFLPAYPGHPFHGIVQGIGWANYPDNLSEQSGLPEIRRTLNWVVLAARFPVRITLTDRDSQHPFRMGMTAFTHIRSAGAQP